MHEVVLDGLEDYTFYAFYVSYETNHSIGNATQVFVSRTTEGSTYFCN